MAEDRPAVPVAPSEASSEASVPSQTPAPEPASGELPLFEPATPPLSAFDFEALDVHGAKHRLSDWRGQAILLNFWATWCAPCRHELPSMARLQERLGGGASERSFRVLAINLGEDAARVRTFLARFEASLEAQQGAGEAQSERQTATQQGVGGASSEASGGSLAALTFLLDADESISRAYDVGLLPTSYVIDARGRVRARVLGARDWDHPRIVDALRAVGAFEGRPAAER